MSGLDFMVGFVCGGLAIGSIWFYRAAGDAAKARYERLNWERVDRIRSRRIAAEKK